MGWMRGIRLRLRELVDRRSLDAELDEEMRFHIERETQANIEAGMSADEARRRAHVTFGGVERHKEQVREGRVGQWLDDLQRDVRRALRSMARNPGFTAVALLMLALGIGANTAIFSVVNAVLLEPLPFEQPSRIVQVHESHLERGIARFAFSQPNAIEVMERAASFSGVGLIGSRSATLTGDGTPEQIDVGTITPGFFDVLGVRPLAGRTLLETDVDVDRAVRVLLLSEDLWINRFGGDPEIVGTTVSLDGDAAQVVGVMPRGLLWFELDAWEPLPLVRERSRSDHRWLMIARLGDGVAIEVAQSEMDAIGRQMNAEIGQPDDDMGFLLDPASTWAADETLRRSLWILMGSAGLLLLIACLNLTNLQMTRLEGRMRQVTLTQALGAGRGRVVRQLFTESAVLGLAGGVLGIVVAHVGLRGLLALEPGNVPRITEASVDPTVLGFAVAVSLAVGIAAGMLPALRLGSTEIGNALRDSGTRAGSGRSGRRLQSWMVGSETALSLVLLVGAGLLIRSLAEVQSVDNGFDTEGRVTYEVPLPESYGFDEARVFRREVLDRIGAIPTVVSAAAVSQRPVGQGNTVMGILPRGETPETFGTNFSVSWRAVTPDYFRSLGLSLVRGGPMNDDTRGDGPWEVVISESLAEALWPGQDPVAREVELWNDLDRIGVVVGVVEDMRERGPEAGETLAVYFPYSRMAWTPIHFVVHSSGDPMNVVPSIRRILSEIDGDVPLSRVMTLDDLVETATSSRRFTMTLLGFFALLALVLALAGLYGVITQSVGQRARELGVRVALGASGREVLSLVMRQGMVPALAGIVVGLIATVWVSQALSTLLFGISPTDPVTYVSVGILLALAAAAACWMPARATLRLEPSSVLREE